MEIKLLPAYMGNYSSSERSLSKIKFIVLHYTGNTTDTAENNARYFSLPVNPVASAHYFVDSDSIYQSVPDHHSAWAVGGGKYADCARTGGGKFYGECTNSNSISIEMTSVDGAITDETVNNAVWLTKQLMSKYGIDADHVIRHFDVTGKKCPGWSGWTGDGDKWKEFKEALVEKPTPTPAPVIPYVVGKVYTLQGNMNVRKGPDTSYRKLSYAELSSNAKANANPTGSLKPGTRVTCKEIVLTNGAIWIRIPSGWVCAKMGDKTYIS